MSDNKSNNKVIFSVAYSLQTLVKDGITNTLEKTFVSIGYTPHLKLRTLLDCFKHLTTNSKHMCLRIPFFFINYFNIYNISRTML